MALNKICVYSTIFLLSVSSTLHQKHQTHPFFVTRKQAKCFQFELHLLCRLPELLNDLISGKDRSSINTDCADLWHLRWTAALCTTRLQDFAHYLINIHELKFANLNSALFNCLAQWIRYHLFYFCVLCL